MDTLEILQNALIALRTIAVDGIEQEKRLEARYAADTVERLIKDTVIVRLGA